MKLVHLGKESKYLQAIITILRDKDTSSPLFRKSLQKFGRYGGSRIADTLDYQEISVTTPLGEARGLKFVPNVVIIEILRAAVPMAEGLVKVIPSPRIGLISASRGPAPDFKIEISYKKIPHLSDTDNLISVDPMLATGSTIKAALTDIFESEQVTPKRVIIFSLIGAKKGIEELQKFENHYGKEIELFV